MWNWKTTKTTLLLQTKTRIEWRRWCTSYRNFIREDWSCFFPTSVDSNWIATVLVGFGGLTGNTMRKFIESMSNYRWSKHFRERSQSTDITICWYWKHPKLLCEILYCYSGNRWCPQFTSEQENVCWRQIPPSTDPEVWRTRSERTICAQSRPQSHRERLGLLLQCIVLDR